MQFAPRPFKSPVILPPFTEEFEVYDCTGRRVAFAPEGTQKCPRVTLSFHKHLEPAWHYQIIEKD